ncbi:hypothetical protein ARTHROSP310_35640 [Arthrobacter sp. AD-310]
MPVARAVPGEAAFADIVRAGKARYIGVSEWTVDEIRRGVEPARDLGVHLFVERA